MTPERWRQITELFHAARERDPAQRDAFVADACREDPTLRPEVEAMLNGHEHAGPFGDTPLFVSASPLGPGSLRVGQLAPGSHLGPYRILSPLGAGEVYRARDSKLNRDVALKVLPEAFSLDSDRLARFKREAQVLASLNHPNIGHIYGLEDANGAPALVLELVEGPTLADRIAHGPIPVDEALPMARQIAPGARGRA